MTRIIITFFLFGIIYTSLRAQIPQLEINGYIQSDSLAGSGVSNVVADANGMLKIDSNTVSSSLIELRDSTGDLKFRLDANQNLFQMLNGGDTMFMFAHFVNLNVDSAQFFQQGSQFKSLNTNNSLPELTKFQFHQIRQKLILNKTKYENNTLQCYPIPPANTVYKEATTEIGVNNLIDKQPRINVSGITSVINHGDLHFSGDFLPTGELVEILVSGTGGSPFGWKLEFDSSGNLIAVEYHGIEEYCKVELTNACNPVKTTEIDRSGGGDTKTKWKSGDGNKSSTVAGGQIESTDVSGTPKSSIVTPGRVAVVEGTDIVVMDKNSVSFSGSSGTVNVTVDRVNKKVDFGSADICANSFVPSDRRLKTNLRSLDAVLPDLMKLQSQSYNYRNEGSKFHAGLIAQDVQKIYPHLVTLNQTPHEDFSDQPYLILNYTGLIPILIKGLQEVADLGNERDDLIHSLVMKSKEINELKEQLNKQDELLTELEKRIESLESETK